MKEKINNFLNNKYISLILMYLFSLIIFSIGASYFLKHELSVDSVGGFIVFCWHSCMICIGDLYLEVHK